MSTSQAIERTFGITVFGSALVRVEPDVASIRCSVSRLEQQPKDAFRVAHKAAASVSGYLSAAKISEVGSSRVTLSQTFRSVGGENRFLGYTSRVTFQIVLRELDRLEEILTGLVESGVNDLGSATMQTTRLKEIRADARRNAVAAAREKAENYCQSAGVTLGPVIHIEDVNPDLLSGRFEGHTSSLSGSSTDDGIIRAFDPGEITVSGAVIVAYEIGR